MPIDDEYKKKIHLLDFDQEEEHEGSGTGSQSGEIEFRMANAENYRDDQLSAEDRRRLLSSHETIHELKVKDEKQKRDNIKDLKNGKESLQNYRQQNGTGSLAGVRAHPILSEKFSGVDNNVTPVPTENAADANPTPRNELTNQYQKKYNPENAPRFNPKPNPT